MLLVDKILSTVFTILFSCIFLLLFTKDDVMADGLAGIFERIKNRLPDIQMLYRERNKKNWKDNKEWCHAGQKK